MPTTWENCARFDMRYQIDGQTVENGIGVWKAAAWTEVELLDMANGIVDWWNTSMKPLLLNTVMLQDIVATDLTSIDGSRVIVPVGIPGGSMIGEPMPLNATFAFHKAISSRGRGKSGRLFWPQLKKGDVAEDQVTSIFRDAALEALQALIPAIAGIIADAILVVLHQAAGGDAPGIGTYSHVLTFTATDSFVDSQRDRLPSHKRHKKKKVVTP